MSLFERFSREVDEEPPDNVTAPVHVAEDTPAGTEVQEQKTLPQSLPAVKDGYPPRLSIDDQVGVALAFHYMFGGAPVPYWHPIMELEERTLPKRYQGGNRAVLAGLAKAKHPSGTVRVLETADGKLWWYPSRKGMELAEACLI